MYVQSIKVFEYSESNQPFVVAALKDATEAFLLRPNSSQPITDHFAEPPNRCLASVWVVNKTVCVS